LLHSEVQWAGLWLGWGGKERVQNFDWERSGCRRIALTWVLWRSVVTMMGLGFVPSGSSTMLAVNRKVWRNKDIFAMESSRVTSHISLKRISKVCMYVQRTAASPITPVPNYESRGSLRFGKWEIFVLTQLIAREDFVEFSHRESFESYKGGCLFLWVFSRKNKCILFPCSSSSHKEIWFEVVE